MKFPLKVIITPLILSVAILASPACSKKDPGPTPEEIAATEAAEAQAQAAAEAEALAAAEEAAIEEARLAALAVAEAEAQAAAEAAAAEAEAQAIAAAEAEALILAQEEALRAEEEAARNKASAMAMALELEKAMAIAEAEAAASAEAEARAAMKQEANDLYHEHLAQAEIFKAKTKALSDLIDQNASTISVGVADRLLEMRALIPALIDAFDDLENYEGDDLEATVATIKADFERADTLYNETIALLSEDLNEDLKSVIE